MDKKFETAYESYKKIIAICNSFYDNIIKKIHRNYKQGELLEELDEYLQAILLSIALADKEVKFEELLFIEKLTDYKNLFNQLEGGIKSFIGSSDDKMYELKQLSASKINVIPRILRIVAELDDKIKDVNFAKLILSNMITIITKLSFVDDEGSKVEIELAGKALAPLMSLFPKDNVLEYFKNKK